MSTTARDILNELVSFGALARIIDGQLRVKPPKGGLPDLMRQRVKDNVPGIVKALATHPCEGCGRFAFPEPSVCCFWCRKIEAAERAAA